MNVLAIGNSFSCNANTYLYEIAKASGANIFNANLVIGGCSLDMHFRNMMADRRDYKLELMGVDTGFSGNSPASESLFGVLSHVYPLY